MGGGGEGVCSSESCGIQRNQDEDKELSTSQNITNECT